MPCCARRLTAEGKPDPLHEVKDNYPGFGVEIAAILQKAMAINARDRFASAWEFREALRQLGRSPRPVATNDSPRSVRSANTVAVTTVMLPASVKTDPFDSYSILKPELDLFRVTTHRRWPALAVVGFAIVLVTLASSFPSGLLKALTQAFSLSNAAAFTDASNAVSSRPARTAARLRRPRALTPFKFHPRWNRVVRATPPGNDLAVTSQNSRKA